MERQGRPTRPPHPGEVARDEMNTELRRQLRKARAEITQLNGKLAALATVTATLYHENLALKKRNSDR
ncbi:hypothetical protein ABZ016_24750 [Streptomyces sp. NPDC006372]|uniref:hypothetical protein n=1 Tax=Streptomyces sp. NPDC006372 TaxID=3155599 RepID=UPI0033BCDC47